MKKYFSALLPELCTRASRATTGVLGFTNRPLNRYLTESFSSPIGKGANFLADPVFEATFGWHAAKESLAELSSRVLDPKLVEALDTPPKGMRDDYRFPKTAHPYLHQLEAWDILRREEPQSVVVTSGTGSGKTECFMVPILDRLVREQKRTGGQIKGVRALFLYPLNALINSQRDRLLAWTHAFGSDVRFCLYNGLTKESAKEAERRETPNQVIDRETLRANPPPILVTNATMLEFMLVRANDAPILEQSQGQLEWIVLDEAHSYIGSQAAELALLLRRVMHGFGVKADQVRFVATSATIGGEEAAIQLRRFLADLAGVPESRVHVVKGARHVPPLPAGKSPAETISIEELDALAQSDNKEAPSQLFDALCVQPLARNLRDKFTQGRGCLQLSDVTRALNGSADIESQRLALRWLDVVTSAKRDGQAFLPLRGHLFHQVMAGLWACVDSKCSHRKNTALDDPEWHYGSLYFEERRNCQCGAPVHELRTCLECNETFLSGVVTARYDGFYLVQQGETVEDEFALEAEQADEGEVPGAGQTPEVSRTNEFVLLGRVGQTGFTPTQIDSATGKFDPAGEVKTVSVNLRGENGCDDQILTCPCCNASAKTAAEGYRRAILGAPFLLGQIIPTLLEFAPDYEDTPISKPYRGRRMISFTDSRQGTARIAAKIQQDSELHRVRGIVYQRALAASNEKNPMAVGLEADLAQLRAIPNPPDMLISMIRDKEKSLANMKVANDLSYADLVRWMAVNEPDIDRIFRFYRDADPATFTETHGETELVKTLLAREIARRPKRQNNLETMGLVAIRYPKLDLIKQPPGLVSMTIAEWKDFLKTALDMFVREKTAVDLPESWRKWGGQRGRRYNILAPTSKEELGAGLARWPQSNKGTVQNRLVRILSFALKIDLTTTTGRDTIDDLLRQAWNDLVNCGLLQGSNAGRFLLFEDMSFGLIESGFLCPVTRRVLDTTFKGITPYLPSKKPTAENAQCQPINIPRPPQFANDLSSMEHLVAVRDWLETAPQIRDLRTSGIWSNLNDRVVEGAAYFRAAEHSAQQPAHRLTDYEQKFKGGEINLLSCSTTMEMGVDIGGISVVAMNNVPPHPANYLQRAGRAGRRSETRSVALTLCKNNPHDQSVFANTRWPFDTQLPMPGISLQSGAIVQRHINAMLLSHYLKHCIEKDDLHKLNCEWFFVQTSPSFSEQFSHWCETADPERDAQLHQGLRSLLRNTCFEGTTTLLSLIQEASRMMTSVVNSWRMEYDELSRQLAEFKGKAAKDPVLRALSIQQERLGKEYLLGELASSGFLPGYGFPTDIASFDTLTADDLVRMDKQRKDEKREDNRYRRRDLASRDRVTALREYAPGADVVMDGLRYRSAGITLNWHAPASATGVQEIQNIRKAWHCQTCGASGTTLASTSDVTCSSCGAGIRTGDSDYLVEYLEPAGFAVDFYESADNDVSHQTFVPVKAPWIHANGDWVALPDPILGRFRVSPDGCVFHHSAGAHGDGYAICLKCGRAEPMSGDKLPDRMVKHRRLRGKQGMDDAYCEGNEASFAIKRNLRLGHEVRTDVLEIQLNDGHGQALADSVIAFSLATALREAIADQLGVQIDELGCDAKLVRDERGGTRQSLVIYDRNASGYVGVVTHALPDLLRKARSIFDCPQNCSSTCQHCLSSYDNRFRLDDLDRRKATEFLTPEWLNRLQLPAPVAFFGEAGSQAEFQPLPEAVWRELSRPEVSRMTIVLGDDDLSSDLASHPVRRQIGRWLGKEKFIEILLAKGALSKASEETQSIIGRLAASDFVEVSELASPIALCGAGKLIAFAHYGTFPEVKVSAWAIPADGSSRNYWSGTGANVLVRGPYNNSATTLIDKSSLLGKKTESGTLEFEIKRELDGQLQGFGDRFWKLLTTESVLAPLLNSADIDLCGVTYRDRYINSPVTVALLIETMNAIKKITGSRWDVKRIAVETSDTSSSFDGRRSNPTIRSDWASSYERDQVLREALMYCGMESHVETLGKHETAHARQLELRFSNQQHVFVRLDQGFSYWKVEASASRGWGPALSFNFSASPSAQGEAVANLRTSITGQEYPTFIVVRQSA